MTYDNRWKSKNFAFQLRFSRTLHPPGEPKRKHDWSSAASSKPYYYAKLVDSCRTPESNKEWTEMKEDEKKRHSFGITLDVETTNLSCGRGPVHNFLLTAFTIRFKHMIWALPFHWEEKTNENKKQKGFRILECRRVDRKLSRVFSLWNNERSWPEKEVSLLYQYIKAKKYL